MKRFDPSNKHEDGMAPRTDGEWIRYSDHVEAMKRIAGAPVAQGLTDEQIADMASAYGVYYDADPAIIGRFARALLAASPAKPEGV